MPPRIAPLLALSCALTWLARPANADVWIVDQNGAADFTLVQDAVNSANDGDTILVKRQHDDVWIDGFVVDGKGLTVIAHDAQRLPILSIEVRNLLPEQTFVLSGFNVLTRSEHLHPVATNPFAVGVLLENNGGSIRIQDCTIQGTQGWTHPANEGPGTHALEVHSSQDVVLSHNEFIGGEAWEEGHNGGFGLMSTNSMTVAYDSSVLGGLGGYDIGYMNDSTGGGGGDGARVIGGELFLSSCIVSGGGGGSGGGWSASYGGNGGNGLSLSSSATTHALACELAFGPGGWGIHGLGQDGVVVRGQLTELATVLPTLRAARAFASESSTIDLQVTGTPGDDVTLLVSRTTVALTVGPAQGFEHTNDPVRIHIGPIPANGELLHPFSLPPVTSGGTQLHLQLETRLGTLPRRLSNPYSLSVLDSAHVPNCGQRVYVDQSVAAGGDGQSWATAYNDLRLALDRQPACPDNPTEVWVAEGTYRPAAPAGDRGLSFFLSSGVHLYGGFAGNETQLSERKPALHPVVLTGDLNGNDLPGFLNRADNSRHVLRTGSLAHLSSQVRIDGVTVRGGESTDTAAEDGGAGIQARCLGLLVARCVVEDNRTTGFGAGAGLLQWRCGDTTIVESLFQQNVAGGYAGGIRVWAEEDFPDVRIANCVVRGNIAGDYGAGISIQAYSGKLSSTTVYANSGEKWGGVLAAMDGPFQVSNCVFWGNRDTLPSSTLFEENFSYPYPAWSNMRHTCVEGWTGLGGATNTGLDPRFVDGFGADGLAGTADDDLRLGGLSPCIDAGWNAAVLPDVADLDNDGDTSELTPTDLDHKRRFVDNPQVPDTGNGTAPVVDMGAYEQR